MTLKDKYINPLTDFGFEKLFEIAEIAKFTPKEREQYEESLKYYRDLKNVVDASKEEGIIEGKIEVAKNLKKQGISTEIINKATGLSKKEIDNL